ncbi:MAG TPA: DUF5602 domain-containing protein [Pyrinomonadaceae bacterium]|nr:DUF5602 domain-containing protein [Pyrinomonadaceae bacterium]
MNQNQIAIGSFESSPLALVMSVDRVFLFRKFFVALAVVLVATGLVFAQRSGGRNASMNLKSSPSAATKAGTIVGEVKQLGKGQVRSWATFDRQGNPTAIGLTFSEEALSTLPAELPPGQEGMELSLALPAQAASTAFKHIGLDWNPHGHPPEKIYDVAHFDFHFYMITEEERAGITVQGDDVARSRRQPAAEYVPEGYIHVPDSEIPRMGSHWVNPLSKELQGHAFTTTFLFGSYDGRLVFAEPMISKAFLETKTNVTELIKLPAKYARRAYYPTKYSVRYDPAAKEYTVALEGMTLR